MLIRKKQHRMWGSSLLIAIGVVGMTCFGLKQFQHSFGSVRIGSRASVVQQGLLSGEEDESGEGGVTRSEIAKNIGQALNSNELPGSLQLDVEGSKHTASVDYGLDEELQNRMEKLMKSYGPDYGAFVAMDASTGRILALVSYTRENTNLGHLALRATFPVASVFKVVTASAAIENNKANPGTVVAFNGSNTSLYKNNVKETKVNRWTRRMTMREAFARSVNTVFSKLGLFYVGPQELMKYAERFHFNHPIESDMPVQTGYIKIADNDYWSVATAASGFTRDTTMSPVQGAMIAAAVANDGVMMEPYLVRSLVDEKGEMIYQAIPRRASVAIEPRSAENVRLMMRETVRNGTSRKSFRQMVQRHKFDGIDVGGKSGSLTGTDPFGRCDWFVGYMRYKGAKIAVSALTVNEEKWRVKSAYLASSFFIDYANQVQARETASVENIKKAKTPIN